MRDPGTCPSACAVVSTSGEHGLTLWDLSFMYGIRAPARGRAGGRGVEEEAGGGTDGFPTHQAAPAVRVQRGRRPEVEGASRRRGHRRLLDGEPRRPDAATRRREA